MSESREDSRQSPSGAPAWTREGTGAELPTATSTHPDDILNDPAMTAGEKRAVLASWASDAHAIPGRPALRRLDSGAIVAVDDILSALQSLDRRKEGVSTSVRASRWSTACDRRRGAATLGHLARIVRRRRDDDDEPPPCPALAGRPVRMVFTDAFGQVSGQPANLRPRATASRTRMALPAAA